MATKKQTKAARENIKKAQTVWQSMSSRARAMAQPEGRRREKPGEVGGGNYYRIVVRPKEEFVTFRYHDVGEKGGDVQRLSGKRSSGSWDTHAWLISKSSAHPEDGVLVPDTDDAREAIERLGSEPRHVKGDIYEAEDRPDVPEYAKPTPAQQRARMENIEKAQAARWQGHAPSGAWQGMAGGRSRAKRR